MKIASGVSKERVIVYIDGFNLYFGMTEKWKDVKWLDVCKLARLLLQPGQELMSVKYFTSRVANNPEKQKRQNTYIEAIEMVGTQIFYGHYQPNTEECRRCGNVWPSPKEKMTDVNIATHLLIDAKDNLYDTALLISGDSDLVPPIKAVHQHYPSKKVIVGFPPNRQSENVKKAARGYFSIGRKSLVDSQLPDSLVKEGGFILRKPVEWG